MFRVLLVFVLVVKLFAYEIENGKTFFLEIDGQTEVFKDNNKLKKYKHQTKEGTYFIVLPIDYKSKLGEKELLHVKNNKSVKKFLHIKSGNYKKETLQVNPKKVNPPKSEQDRIYKEYLESKNIYATFTKKRYWEKPFNYPLKTKITSDFGNARVYNGFLKSYHSGTDFRADIGTPLKVINNGIVVIASDRYYAGNTVVIDHGEGIYSIYAHLSKINVKVGQSIKKGEVFGLSGATGRVTGPHLHFGIIVDSVRVDPLDFIIKVNSLFFN